MQRNKGKATMRRKLLAWLLGPLLGLLLLDRLFLPQIPLILCAGIAVYYGVRRGLLPLERLKRAVSDRSHLDLSPIEEMGVPGEVMPLVEQVNDLLLRLGKTLDFQNRFIADAAHQLRTPVAGIKAQI